MNYVRIGISGAVLSLVVAASIFIYDGGPAEIAKQSKFSGSMRVDREKAVWPKKEAILQKCADRFADLSLRWECFDASFFDEFGDRYQNAVRTEFWIAVGKELVYQLIWAAGGFVAFMVAAAFAVWIRRTWLPWVISPRK